MHPRANLFILRANAVYLLVASAFGLIMDMVAVHLGLGPFSRAIAAAPNTAIGFVEAHGLAFILGCVLWNLPVTRFAHLSAFAVVALLGTCNLSFWPLFRELDALPAGYVSTTGHCLFATLQLLALASSMQAGQKVLTPAAG